MRWTISDVPDPRGWRLIDSRTGLEYAPDGFVLIYIDDCRHELMLQNQGTYEEILIYAPRVVVLVERKVVLLFMRDVDQLVEEPLGEEIDCS